MAALPQLVRHSRTAAPVAQATPRPEGGDERGEARAGRGYGAQANPHRRNPSSPPAFGAGPPFSLWEKFVC